MATQIKLRRTSNVENKTLSQGEPLYDINNNLLYVGKEDGSIPNSSSAAINKLTSEDADKQEIVKFTIGGNQTFEKEIIPKQVQFAIDGISYTQVDNFNRVFKGALENDTIICTPYNDETQTSAPDFKSGAFIYLIIEKESTDFIPINSTVGSPHLKFEDKTYFLSREGNVRTPFFLEYNKWYQFIYRKIGDGIYFDLVEMNGALEWETWEA